MQVPNGSATVQSDLCRNTFVHGPPRDRAAVGVRSWHATVPSDQLTGIFPMHSSKKAALLWSGGKDSALALYHARKHHPALQIVKLVTCLSQAYDRVSMHGVRRQLIKAQAEALGLPVDWVVIPHQDNPSCPMAHTSPGTTFPPNDTYTQTMLAALGKLKKQGIEVIVFGDIFLEDLRAFRERLLESAGLEGCYPLWGRDSAELYSEFCRLGFQAITVCVDTERLPAQCCGQFLTPEFQGSLAPAVDPCGERGEYHSFTFDGPLFRRPVPFSLGGIHHQPPFAFQELFPGGFPDVAQSDTEAKPADSAEAGQPASQPALPGQTGQQKGESAKRSVALAVLILAAVLMRLVPHPPNFAPITAMAVFGGVTYLSRRAALLVPLAALLLSDLAREVLYRYGLTDTWGLYRGMWVVYGTTALVALIGQAVQGTRSPVLLAGATLSGSCLFFLLTNFAVWAEGAFYPHTLEGVAACYTAALPFFRNALLGDFTYATVLFGSWALAEARYPVLRPAPAGATF